MTAHMLYHGTSTPRLKLILEENCLRRQGFGGFPNPKVSFTPERYGTEYWAKVSAAADRDPRNRVPDGADAAPVVLVFDAEVLAGKYTLVPYRDPIWGGGECDWECELYSRRRIKPLRKVLVSIEQVEAAA